VQREADDQHECEAELVGGGGLADREPFAEVVQADAGSDEECESARGRQVRKRANAGELRLRGGAWPEKRALPPAPDPGVVVDKAHQADDEAAGEQGHVAGEGAPLVVLHDLFDRADRVREDVPEQEDQDSRRARGEQRLHADGDAAHARERQAEEDREAGDCAEDECLGGAHRPVVRLTLHAV
jgi:hypothetical protein